MSESGDSNGARIKSGIKINVVDIDKLIHPKTIMVNVDFKGDNLGSSENVKVKATEAKIDWQICYELTDLTETVMYDLTAHPLVFTVLYDDTSDLASTFSSKVEKNKKVKSSKKRSSNNPSRKESLSEEGPSMASTNEQNVKSGALKSIGLSKQESSAKSGQQSVLGMANLDLLPLLLGKDQIADILLIHPTLDQRGSKSIAWTNLPRMQVLVSGEGHITHYLAEHFNNILLITLESLYNISPEFNESIEVATLLPHAQDFQVAKFTNGSLVVDHLTQTFHRKKWSGLSDKQGQGALSSYKISDDTVGLKSTLDITVTNETIESVPRIYWNQLCRSYLTVESQKIFKDKLIKYQCWPVELLNPKSTKKVKEHSETKSKCEKRSLKDTIVTGGNEKSKRAVEMKTNHFVTFLDLSMLLYPGVTNTRVVSQLYTFTEDAIKNKFGTDKTMFEEPRLSGGKTEISKKELSRATTPKSSKKGKVVKADEVVEEEPEPLPEPEPVFNAEGDPVFIVIQVELLKPLIEKKTSEEVLESIQTLVPRRPQPTEREQVSIDAKQAFEVCIHNLTRVIHEEYQLFYTKNEIEKSTKNFIMHLHMTGSYTKMKESIKENVEGYIQETMGFPYQLSTMKCDHEDTLTDVYLSLVSKMCSQVNTLSSYDVDEYNPQVTCEELLYFAVEAMEEDSFHKAQEYLLQRLENSKKTEPQFWLDYAIYWMRKQEYEKAGECAREALALDLKYIAALFFHGLLSWLTEDFRTAEMFLLAVVSFDPHNLEGWIALHIFHKQMNNHLDAGTELLNGKRCIMEVFLVQDDKPPLMSWYDGMTEYNRIFLLTAVLMLELYFPELAELALSYDLLLHGRSVNYLYYLAVCHYLQGRYTDSLTHLQEALKISWEEECVWTLKGHNLYKLQLTSEAKEAFQFAINCAEVPELNHLIQLRLGNIFLSEEDHKGAHKCYLTVCRLFPTPLSWLGLGITAFLDDEMNAAELALSEANMLDGRMAQIWGYLALVNLLTGKTAVYSKCVSQAHRYGLDDPILLERLAILGQLVQPINY